ncbi:C40 family peptidase [Streptomyces chartreusis]|uniref:C40 family peptidase n=1 Tax=Streptomyces TaxID=1883 RepID=UPI0004C4FA7B|nr:MULTISPECIES: NlpC/P60 family protein [unclassified Streptomyces]SEC61971.1 NlpC/P60 family protein [Streptomyces sp. KS_5]SED03185.1 NlpC/P60 family protein [Streptomyces sp. PAN_FS17]
MAGKKKSRPVVTGLVLLALVGTSGYLTLELRKQDEQGVTEVRNVGVLEGGRSTGTATESGKETWSRLENPARSVLRGSDGQIKAVFTDGARTATLTGPARTFQEPTSTASKVSTTDWVRLMPERWAKGAEQKKWFKDWYAEYKDSKEDDIFAFAFQYVAGAPVKKDAQGTVYAGDANFGPLNTTGAEGGDLRLEQSDFYDYLGVQYPFRDGTVGQPESMRARSIDCSGFIRMVLGYRARYPLMSSDASGDGLPRTANGMARSKAGVDILPLAGISAQDRPSAIDQLQPGDLVFFKLDTRTGERLDHVGMVLGHDTEGHLIFVSSREEVNGPTIGDVGGVSRLDGNGYYAKTLRSAKRL